ncbi:hypothetical protein EDD11_003978 [Mortierella claussenii]|nr:hypothetical protein EDD11_003978 [Mortierella claussenii]
MRRCAKRRNLWDYTSCMKSYATLTKSIPSYNDTSYSDDDDDYARTGATNKKQRKMSLPDLPHELLIQVIKMLFYPPDLLHLSQACTTFRNLIDERAWSRVVIAMNPNYTIGVEVDHIRGGTEVWRQIALDEHHRRTRDWRAPLKLHANDTSSQYPPHLLIDLELASHIQPAHMLPPPSTMNDNIVPRSRPGRWSNAGPPASHTDKTTHKTISAYMQMRSHGEYQIALYGFPNHQSPLAIISSDCWAHPNVDQYLDPELPLGVAQLMDIRQFPQTRDNLNLCLQLTVNIFTCILKVVEVYICDNDLVASIVNPNPSCPRQVPYRPDVVRGKVETIVPSSRHEVIRGRMAKLYSIEDKTSHEVQDRIALFGIHQGAGSQAIVMTSPLFVSSWPKCPRNYAIDRRIDVASTTAQNCSRGEAHLSPTTPATPATRFMETSEPAVSHPPVPSKWDCHALGGAQALRTSCMVLFPPQSDFDHLLVIMDRFGKGQIWDWQRRIRVATLAPPAVLIGPTELHQQQQQQGQGEVISNRNQLCYWGIQVNWTIEEPTRLNMGSTTVTLGGAGHRERGDFRIVALADGEHKEWETSWWNVGEKELRNRQIEQKTLLAQGGKAGSWEIRPNNRHFEQSTLAIPFDSTSTVPPSQPLVQIAQYQGPQESDQSSVEIDVSTADEEMQVMVEQTLPPQESDVSTARAVLFIAFLIWEHYRITLTTDCGICLFDMDQEANNDVQDLRQQTPQWVTHIKGAAEDPLIDIATIGDYLILTRKYSHMIWPFRRVLRQP